jgi:hypothetical protein
MGARTATGAAGPGLRPARPEDSPASEEGKHTEVAGLSKADAEALLDWLEAHGCRERALLWVEGKGFTVRYVRPD